MAEWLGTALQKLLQRFESASDLQERLTFLSVVFCFLRCGFSSPTHPKKQRRVGASPIVLLFLCGCMQPAKNTLRALLTLKEGCGDSCVDGSLGSPIVVSPRVRAKALTSNLASDLWKRLTVLSVVFVFAVWLFKPHSPKKAVTSWCKPHRPAFFVWLHAARKKHSSRLAHLKRGLRG